MFPLVNIEIFSMFLGGSSLSFYQQFRNTFIFRSSLGSPVILSLCLASSFCGDAATLARLVVFSCLDLSVSVQTLSVSLGIICIYSLFYNTFLEPLILYLVQGPSPKDE